MSKLRMPELNYVTISGNLTKDPVLRTTSSGIPVANFYIASNRKYKDKSGIWKEDVCYVGIVAWHHLADSCEKHLTRGSAVIVEGELQSRNFESDEGGYRSIVEIKAHKIQFLNSGFSKDSDSNIEELNENVKNSNGD